MVSGFLFLGTADDGCGNLICRGFWGRTILAQSHRTWSLPRLSHPFTGQRRSSAAPAKLLICVHTFCNPDALVFSVSNATRNQSFYIDFGPFDRIQQLTI